MAIEGYTWNIKFWFYSIQQPLQSIEHVHSPRLEHLLPLTGNVLFFLPYLSEFHLFVKTYSQFLQEAPLIWLSRLEELILFVWKCRMHNNVSLSTYEPSALSYLNIHILTFLPRETVGPYGVASPF